MQRSTPIADSSPSALTEFDARYGRMFAFGSDGVIARSLELYGEWAEHELSYMRQFIRPNSIVVDVGANIGTHTLAFSRWAHAGKVIALEAQPVVSCVLIVNCLLNGRPNVSVVNGLCGWKSGATEIDVDYGGQKNIGGVSFAEGAGPGLSGLADQPSKSGQPNSTSTAVPNVRLDEVVGDDRVDFIKVDVEGMELDVLYGGWRTLTRSYPTIYLEQLDTKNLAQIHRLLSNIGYHLYWLETHPFNTNNYRKNTVNIWSRTETGLLALPSGVSPPAGLTVARPDDLTVPALLNAKEGTFVED